MDQQWRTALFSWGLVSFNGKLFLIDNGVSTVYQIDPATGNVVTVAGNGNFGPPYGNGGPATSAQFGSIYELSVDSSGNLYITDLLTRFSDGGVIRCVNMQPTTQTILGVSIPAGRIDIVAGNSTFGFSGDGGPATSA